MKTNVYNVEQFVRSMKGFRERFYKSFSGFMDEFCSFNIGDGASLSETFYNTDKNFYWNVGSPLEVISLRLANIYDAKNMAKWRCKYYKSFFTWIKPDINNVQGWLAEYQTRDNDLLFIVCDHETLTPRGQLALYDINKESAEFGRIIRGDRRGPKKLMYISSFAILNWAFKVLGLEKVYLSVFSDNQKAIDLYFRLGFIRARTYNVYKTQKDGLTVWTPKHTNKGSKKVNYMVLGKERWGRKHGN